MKRVVAATMLAAVSGLAVPAQASEVSVCVGRATLVVAGVTVIDQEVGCQVVDLP